MPTHTVPHLRFLAESSRSHLIISPDSSYINHCFLIHFQPFYYGICCRCCYFFSMLFPSVVYAPSTVTRYFSASFTAFHATFAFPPPWQVTPLITGLVKGNTNSQDFVSVPCLSSSSARIAFTEKCRCRMLLE